MKKIIPLIIIILVLFSSVRAQGAEVYVSPLGDDGNSGTLLHPLKSIAYALKVSDVVILRGGEYSEGISIRVPNKTVKAFAGERVVIRPAGTFAGWVAYDAVNVTLQGLIFDASNVSNTALKITSGAHNINVINCEVFGARNSHGILISDGARDVLIRGGSVHDNGALDVHHGIYASSVDGVVIDGVEIYNNRGMGVHVYGSCPGCVTVIQNSNIHDNYTGIGAFYGAVYITDNIITNTGNYGIRMQYSLESAYVSGNEISYPTPYWTALYVANFNGVANITGNNIHDSYLGLWVRQNGTGTVFVSGNVINADDDVLIQNTTIQVIEYENE